MFERYTESARHALFFARYETSDLGGDVIEPDHLLLGLLRVSHGVTDRLFARANLTYADARRVIRARNAGGQHGMSVELPLSARAKRALDYAAEEADRLQHSDIGTEHLLLGLLREERPCGDSLLQSQGLNLERVRDEIVLLLRADSHSEEPPEGELAGASSRSGAAAAELFHSHVARDLAERVARIEEMLAALASLSEGNQPALELIAAIDLELASLKLRAGGTGSVG